jgi:hypothetical protein
MPSPIAVAISDFFKDGPRWVELARGFWIDGVEVTQSTQHYNARGHLTQAADHGADNSIPMIADKPALVRVYLRNRPEPLAGLVGRLELQRPSSPITWNTRATFAPSFPGSDRAEPDPGYAAERGSLWSTMNFRIPAAEMRGRMRLVIRVELPGTATSAERVVDINASLSQTLRIRGFPIRYQGPDAGGNQVSLPRTTVADFAATAAAAIAMFPVGQTPDITLTGDFNWFAPMTGAPTADDPGGCAPSWNSLLWWLKLVKLADGNRTDRIYYGLLPAGTPTGTNTGCGSGGGVAAGLAGDQATMAHEFGHVLGFGHSPCGLPADAPNDANYPAYEPYDTAAARMASIGEYGVDVVRNTVLSPATVFDFMSYCGPQWIGPYHYRLLLQHGLLDPRWITDRSLRPPAWAEYDYVIPELDLPRPPEWRGPELTGPRVHQVQVAAPVPVLALIGRLVRGRLVDARILRLATRPDRQGMAIAGSMVELLDAEGALLDRARLRLMTPLAGGCGCGGGGQGPADPPGLETGLVQAMLGDRDDIAAVRVTRDGEELLTARAAAAPPSVGAPDAHIEGDALHLRWQVDAAPGATILSIPRWAAEDGEWQAIGASDSAQEARVALETFAPSLIRVRVLVSDGFHTVESPPTEVRIPDRGPTAAIIWPQPGSVTAAGEKVALSGMGVGADGRGLPDSALSWELDGRAVGTGRSVDAEPGDWEGEHRATLRVRDTFGEARASVTFLVTCSGRPPRRYAR